MGPGVGEGQGFLRRTLARLVSTDAEIEAAQLQEAAVESGAVPIVDVRDRQRACVSGTLRAVTLRPRAGVPALEAELYDGSGTLSICWLGRRRIPGITPGRVVSATGFVAYSEGRPMMFNPRYELRSADE
jgi:hypothetical protein